MDGKKVEEKYLNNTKRLYLQGLAKIKIYKEEGYDYYIKNI